MRKHSEASIPKKQAAVAAGLAIAAAGAGAVAALLLAPKSGKETREDLKQKGREKVDYAKSSARGRLEEARNRYEKAVEEVEKEAENENNSRRNFWGRK